MTCLYIIRGVSGSGKTTLAAKMATQFGCQYFEADQFFVKDGVYEFNAHLLHTAHEWCYAKVKEEMLVGRDVIVSNTFTRLWEMRRYLDMAIRENAKIRIITCRGNYQNVHGLTEEMILRQKARFQSNVELAKELMHDAVKWGRIVFSYNG